MGEEGETSVGLGVSGEEEKDLDSTTLPTSPGQEQEGQEASVRSPFDQYYAQLTHQQNMLQDSVRVTAYQSAIINNAVDFKVSS